MGMFCRFNVLFYCFKCMMEVFNFNGVFCVYYLINDLFLYFFCIYKFKKNYLNYSFLLY